MWICIFLISFVSSLSLTLCCHLPYLCSVFTTHFHLPTCRISLAGDIYIVSNLKVRVCTYCTKTDRSLRAMGKCTALYGLENTMGLVHGSHSLLNSPSTQFCHSLHSCLPIKLKLLFCSTEQIWNANEGLEESRGLSAHDSVVASRKRTALF